MKTKEGLFCAIQRRSADGTAGKTQLAALAVGSSLMVIASVLAAHSQPARAADAAPQVAQAETGLAAANEEIIVTARRKAEDLQDVPQTVTAVTSTTIQQLNLQNLSDLSSVVGGLTITQVPGFADSFTIRGISFNPSATTTESAAFYVNEGWVTNNFVTNSNFDVGQIEFLSGPQGTLRGESAPTGAFTITTHRADLERWGGYINGTATHLGNVNVNGAVNAPIVRDKLAIRLAGIADLDDGNGIASVNNPQGPYHHVYGGRASLQFVPNDDITVNLMAQHLFIHDSQYVQEYGPGALGGTVPTAPRGYNGPPIAVNQRESADFIPGTTLTHEDIATANIDWRFHGQKLSYVGDYWDWGYTTGVNGNVAIPGETPTNAHRPGIFPQSTQWTWGSELRLASDEPLFNKLLDYTVGVYYRHSLDHVYNFTGGSQLAGVFGPPNAPSPFIYNDRFNLYTNTVAPRTEKEFSANVYLTFHLPGNNELSAGTRWIDYKDVGTIDTFILPGSFNATPLAAFRGAPCSLLHFTSTYPGFCDVPIAASKAFHAVVNGKGYPWVYQASLSHKFNDDLLAYINSGSSWRPPAFTVGVINGTNNAVLNSILNMKPEKSYSFEGGIKSTWFDKRLRVNFDYYHQIYSPAIAGATQNIFYLSNNGVAPPSVAAYPFSYNASAKVNGIDADVGATITKNWTADLSAGWASSHISGLIPCNPPGNSNKLSAFPPGTVIFLCPSNASLSIRPNFTASLRSEYDHPITSGVDAFLRGLYTFYGRNPNADIYYVQGAYGILNLYMGLRSPDGAWEASFFIKNALNTTKILGTEYGGPDLTPTAAIYAPFGDTGYSRVSLTPRQEFGITFTYAFGSR